MRMASCGDCGSRISEDVDVVQANRAEMVLTWLYESGSVSDLLSSHETPRNGKRSFLCRSRRRY